MVFPLRMLVRWADDALLGMLVLFMGVLCEADTPAPSRSHLVVRFAAQNPETIQHEGFNLMA